MILHQSRQRYSAFAVSVLNCFNGPRGDGEDEITVVK